VGVRELPRVRGVGRVWLAGELARLLGLQFQALLLMRVLCV
jgi:hypothetical protein